MKEKMQEKSNYFTLYKKADLTASMAKQAQEHDREAFYKVRLTINKNLNH